MGSAIGAATGLQKAGIDEPAIAIFGDSAFYHSGLNALVHASATKLNLLTIVLDNGGAVTTGGQSTPNNALSSFNDVGTSIGIVDLASSCGVEFIWIIKEDDDAEKMSNIFREALTVDTGLNMVVVQKSCKPIEE
jgi:indolepyruvate ferredoxin oxidoreductase alpha subunit